MKPEPRVDRILQLALEQPPGEREAYIHEVCGHDEQLRREVLISLESHQQSVAGEPAAGRPARESSNYVPDLKAGDFVGPYRIVRVLGYGGMGDVYLAEHMGLSREVALKMLPDDSLDDPQRVQRFRQEARAVMTLNHPNVVTVYDIGAAESGYFLSTEFVEGETLRDRMLRIRLTVVEAVEIAEQVASALAYAHERGVIHRDIKPENIMLRPDGYVKVLDFGLAKLMEQGEHTSTDESQKASTLTLVDTSPGIILGTVHYMSPEQARGLPIDERTDIWSLGVVIYEMVAGRSPFEAASKSEIVAAILLREPLPIARFARDVPAELERIITRALQKDRDERYQVIKDLLIDLKNLRQDVELASKLERSGFKDPSGRFHSVTGTHQQAALATSEISSAPSIGTPAGLPGLKSRLITLVAILVLAGAAMLLYKACFQ